jgi:hypothetical protein
MFMEILDFFPGDLSHAARDQARACAGTATRAALRQSLWRLPAAEARGEASTGERGAAGSPALAMGR